MSSTIDTPGIKYTVPGVLYIAKINTTAAVEIPFGTLKVMNNISFNENFSL